MHVDAGLKAAGTWIALGSLLFLGGQIVHPPESAQTVEAMALVVQHETMWRTSHWLVAAGLFFIAAGSLVALVAGSRLTLTGVRMTAWAVVAMGSAVIMILPVIEATVMIAAASAGDAAMFALWESLGDGLLNAAPLIVLAMGALAWIDARSDNHITPRWAAGIAAVCAVLAAGQIVGLWLGIDALGVLGLANFPIFLWFGWFGLGLSRPSGMSKLIPAPAPHH